MARAATQNYRHLLAAVDFSPADAKVLARAQSLTRLFKARISIAHIVEYIPLTLDNDALIPQSVEVETALVEVARKRCSTLTRDRGWGDAACIVELGSPRLELPRIAQERDVDLIIIGSHGRHGLARFLGSTANGVLHGAGCDVLAVRTGD
ncbi:MAG TPA: universal stress protein [Gammaproteobacteria bacterium]|nr:universal stress protein [Gammaproteobacteria bacterium]